MANPNQQITSILGTIDTVNQEAERRQIIHGLDVILPDELFLGDNLILPRYLDTKYSAEPVVIPSYTSDSTSGVVLDVQVAPSRKYRSTGDNGGTAVTALAIRGTLRKNWARGDVESDPIEMYKVVYKKKARSRFGKIPRDSSLYRVLDKESDPTLIFDDQVGFYRYTGAEVDDHYGEEVISLTPGTGSFEELGYLLKAFTKRQRRNLKSER